MSEKFKTVLLDPPWNERGGGRIKRGADKHYELLKTPDIIRVILQSEHWGDLDENAHMYLWATNNHLEDALFVSWSVQMVIYGFFSLAHTSQNPNFPLTSSPKPLTILLFANFLLP